MTGPDADRALRLATAATWSAIDVESVGDWQLRSSRGYTGRANSVLVVGDPGIPLAAAAEQAIAFYRQRRRPVLAQIVIGSATERGLRNLGWVEARPDEADCRVMTRPIGADDPVRQHADVELTDLTAEWLAAKFPGGVPDGAAEVIGAGRTVVASVRATGSTFDTDATDTTGAAIVAVGRGSVAVGHVGVSALWVAESQRRKGIGTRMLETLTSWGREQGAQTAFLEVLEDNADALATYRRGGFVGRYAYRYLTAPEG